MRRRSAPLSSGEENLFSSPARRTLLGRGRRRSRVRSVCPSFNYLKYIYNINKTSFSPYLLFLSLSIPLIFKLFFVNRSMIFRRGMRRAVQARDATSFFSARILLMLMNEFYKALRQSRKTAFFIIACMMYTYV